MICKKCKKQYQGSVCPNCGTPAPEQPNSGGSHKHHWWAILLILGIAIVIGVVVWWVCKPDTGQGASLDVPPAIAFAACPKGGKHDIRTITTQAGCTKRGYTTGTCQKCGYTYLDNMVSALGHQWGEPVSVQPLSCTADGLQRETCKRCNLIREAPMSHLGHSYEMVSAEGDGDTVEYICSVCGEKITLNSDEPLPRELKEKAYLPDCGDDFTFLVSCNQGEEYLRENLVVMGENGSVSYHTTVEGDGIYRIAATEPYQQYETYFVHLTEDMALPQYNAKALEFSVIGPDRAEVEFNEDNLIFLKALELEKYETPGQYELQWDEAAQSYYLTLFQLESIDSSMIGKVIGIGDYTSIEEVLADNTRELQFAKLEQISHNSQGQTLLVLSLPELSEVYNELDIYFTGSAGDLQIEGNPEQAFVNAAVNSEGFTEYVTAVHLATESYAGDHGLVVTPLAETTKDNLQFNLTKHSLKNVEGTSLCELELGGEITYTIPLKSKGGHASGSITMKCNAEIFAIISVGGQFEDEKSVDLHLTNSTVTTLGFEMEFKLDYSQEYEETYLVHKNTKKIHTSTCRIAKKETDSTNLEKLTAQQLSDRYNGDKEVMKRDECKVCQAVTGLDGTAYAYNKNTGVLHCMNCIYVTNIKDCNLYTLHPANTFSYANCEHCRPQDRQVKDFDNRMLNAMKGSDWGEQVTSLRERLGDSVGSKKPSQTDPNLTVPINVLGVFNVEIGVTPVFEFDMKASVDFTITAVSKNTYGIRSVGKGFETYNTEEPGEVFYDLKFTGEADAKFGIAMVVKAYPVACKEFACIEIKGQVGLYGHFTGIFNIEGTVGGDVDAYCAARLEVGLYARIDGYWKILWFDDDFVILSEQRLPLKKWGYDRMYYAFEQEEIEITVDDADELVYINLVTLMKAKYLNLTNMKQETGTISPISKSQLNVTVDIKNEDGTPCDYLEYISANGMIYKKSNAPENFSVIITVNVTPKVSINSLGDFLASETQDPCYGYSMDPLVIKVVCEFNEYYVDVGNTEESIQHALINNWWENKIQSPRAYRFFEDGTGETYYFDLNIDEIDTNHVEGTFSYYINDTTLTLKYPSGDYVELQLVLPTQDINWDRGLALQLANIPDRQAFFYEVNYIMNEWENAMYIVPIAREVSEKGDSDMPSGEAEQVILSRDEQYRINVFLSNFSELWFNECWGWDWDNDERYWDWDSYERFESQNASTGELISFVLRHCWVNYQDKLISRWNESGVYMTLDEVNEEMERFFGRKVTLNDVLNNGYYVDGDRIYRQVGIGETYNLMTVADTMYKQADGSYIVCFAIYQANEKYDVGPGVIGDKSVYYLTAEEAKVDAGVSYYLSGIAQVRPYLVDGKNTYQLISYQLNPNEEKGELSDDTQYADSQALRDKYGVSSQTQFVSCLGDEIQTYPEEIYGIASMTTVDINDDTVDELIVLRVSQREDNSEAQLIFEVYQYNDRGISLSAARVVCNISFCAATNVYLFYSDSLDTYCIMVDSYSSGSYTGVNLSSVIIYTVGMHSIEEYGYWEEVPFLGIDVDFETVINTVNAPYAKYCMEYDNRNNASCYEPLCEVEHICYGDSSAYLTRNHKLKIINTSDEQ